MQQDQLREFVTSLDPVMRAIVRLDRDFDPKDSLPDLNRLLQRTGGGETMRMAAFGWHRSNYFPGWTHVTTPGVDNVMWNDHRLQFAHLLFKARTGFWHIPCPGKQRPPLDKGGGR